MRTAGPGTMLAPVSFSAWAGIDGSVQVLIVLSDAFDSSGLSDMEYHRPSGAPK